MMVFWEQAYRMNGNLAAKVAMLSKDDLFIVGDNKYYFFNRYIDVIECGAIIGIINFNEQEKFNEGLEALKEEEPQEANAEIPIKTMLSEQSKLKILFRIIMLNEKIRGLSLQERTDHAFRNEMKAAIQSENEELFNNFVALGVNLLYNKVKNARDAEACLDLMESILDSSWLEDDDLEKQESGSFEIG